jgi:DAK2 domain fusion protein YloV
MDDTPPEQPDPESASVADALKASHLRETLHRYADALKARRKGIDKLNVYPVPDGDTGTNMSLTVQSVVNELRNAVSDDMHAVSTAIGKGAIMGARGNSGAILAQALRGIAESVKDKSAIGPHDIADALEKARKSAYESVLKPVEGTMLTVLTAAAESARKSADKGHELKEQLEHVRIASAEALARTPELLPVLKQAGVVDAGGSGFLLFVDALRYVATGEPIPGITDDEVDADDEPDIDLSHAHTEISELRYEVMYLLEAEDDKIPLLREAWANLGDSIVVVGGDGLWNCHIHTDDIGPAVEAGIAIGMPYQIRITDLQEQTSGAHGDAWQHSSAEPVDTAVVAVVNGKGLEKMFKSCGCEVVVGGQSLNPSVAELLKAVERAPSDSVVILPNNKNVRAAADQVDALTDKSVRVVPTKTMVAGLAALIAYDSSKSLEVVVSAMDEAAANVVCGEVTQAVRNSDSPAGPIKEGDWLGVTVDGINVVAASLQEALCELAATLVSDQHEILTLVEGEGATSDATEALVAWLAEHRENVEVDVQKGGQPLYPYLLGVE